MTGDQLASGFLLAVVGVWLLLRTVTKDDQQKNLVDRILSL